jgi:hypothetical protein
MRCTALRDKPLAALLKQAGYSLQSTRKTRAGLSHPDRNAQFEHSAAQVRQFQRRGQPVVSVRTTLPAGTAAPGSRWGRGWAVPPRPFPP